MPLGSPSTNALLKHVISQGHGVRVTLTNAPRTRAGVAGGVWTPPVDTSARALMASRDSTVRPTSTSALQRPVYTGGTRTRLY